MNKIIKIIIFFSMCSLGHLQDTSVDVDITIDFLISADYTRSTWEQKDFEVFTVNIKNNDSLPIKYYVGFKMRFQDAEIFSGFSKDQMLGPGSSETFTNSILSDESTINNFFEGRVTGWTSDFMDDLLRQGYLPTGKYDIEVEVYSSYECRQVHDEQQCLDLGCLWYLGGTYADFINDPDYDENSVACTPLDGFDNNGPIKTEIYTFTKKELGQNIIIDNPIISEDFDPFSSQLFWRTPISADNDLSKTTDPSDYGIEYRFKIAVHISDDFHSKEEALEDESEFLIYDNSYNNNWEDTWENMNPSFGRYPLSVFDANNYFITFSDLVIDLNYDFLCGHKYVYQVSAREMIKGEVGIWGNKSNPVKSPIYEFQYGSPPTLKDMPNSDKYIDVLPSFEWEKPLDCGSMIGYEIEITSSDDDNFIKYIYSNYPHEGIRYPSYKEGLGPGKTYKWRARTNIPTSIPTQYPLDNMWTEYKIFTLQSLELISPIGNSIENNTKPTFEITGPANISYYSILIGDGNDEKVEAVEIYNKIDPITTFPGKWIYPSQNITEELYPAQIYYWKLVLEDDNGTPLEYISLNSNDEIQKFNIRKINLIEPANSSDNVVRNTIFTWLGPDNVSGYRFLLSDSEDKEIENEQISIDTETFSSGTQSYSYPFNGDYPLDYEKTYFWKVIPLSKDGMEGPPISHSEIWEFNTSDFPTIGEFVDASPMDSRIPMIDIEKSNFENINGIEFTINIYRDIDGQDILDEISGISLSDFPYMYSLGPEIMQYDLTYYIQIQPMKNGENYGPSSTIIPFVIPSQLDDQLQCIISCEFIPNEEPEILTSVLNDLDEASEYLVLFSETEDMAVPLFSETIQGGSTQISITDNIDWGKTYYTQVIPINDEGEKFGASEVAAVEVDPKPGMNEQTALEVDLSVGSIKPVFKIINEITGANAYQITVSSESEMSSIYAQFMTNNSSSIDYPQNETPLEFGKSYYVTAQGYDDDILHGIKSSIVGFFISNITPPKLINEDLFKWEKSVPPSFKYFLEVSLLEDFSSIALEKNVENNFYAINMNELEYNKNYYWRVQPKDSENNNFGKFSNIGFFKSDPPPKPLLNDLSNEESILPSFSWAGLDIAVEYQISLSINENMEDIIWQQNTTNTSIQYPESAQLLEFSKQYFWQISALEENKNILSFSDIDKFKTKSTYPVLGLKPDGGVESFTPILEWDKNDKASSYNILLSSNSDMSSPILNEKSSTNSFSIEAGILQSGNQYYWWIDGLDENEESLAGPSTIALIILPSENSIPLISPSNSDKLNTLTPLFKWGALIGTNTYNLHISVDADFNNLKVNKQVSGTEHLLSDEDKLENSTNYFWRIEGINENDIIFSKNGNFSSPDISELVIQKLDDGVKVSLSNPLFSWEASSEISSFEFRISDNSDFSESLNFTTGATSFTYPKESPNLKFNIEYYWQIRPLNKDGLQIGDWTPVRKFSINASAIVELSSPGNESVVATSNPAFEWSPIENSSKYEIQVTKTLDFSELLWSSSEIVENNTVYPNSGSEKLLYDTDYYWRVRALGENAPLGDFSNPAYSFKISGDFKVELEGPLKESENLQPYFSWESINKAKSYRLVLASDESLSTIIFSTEIQEVFYQYSNSNPPLNFNSILYWQVFALDENSETFGDPSIIGQFTTPKGTIQLEFLFGKD